MNKDFAAEAEKKLAEISGFQKFIMKVFSKKFYIGHEMREDWSGELPFYLFWCRDCRKVSKSYPAGFAERLICNYCAKNHYFFNILKILWNFIIFPVDVLLAIALILFSRYLDFTDSIWAKISSIFTKSP